MSVSLYPTHVDPSRWRTTPSCIKTYSRELIPNFKTSCGLSSMYLAEATRSPFKNVPLALSRSKMYGLTVRRRAPSSSLGGKSMRRNCSTACCFEQEGWSTLRSATRGSLPTRKALFRCKYSGLSMISPFLNTKKRHRRLGVCASGGSVHLSCTPRYTLPCCISSAKAPERPKFAFSTSSFASPSSSSPGSSNEECHPVPDEARPDGHSVYISPVALRFSTGTDGTTPAPSVAVPVRPPPASTPSLLRSLAPLTSSTSLSRLLSDDTYTGSAVGAFSRRLSRPERLCALLLDLDLDLDRERDRDRDRERPFEREERVSACERLLLWSLLRADERSMSANVLSCGLHRNGMDPAAGQRTTLAHVLAEVRIEISCGFYLELLFAGCCRSAALATVPVAVFRSPRTLLLLPRMRDSLFLFAGAC